MALKHRSGAKSAPPLDSQIAKFFYAFASFIVAQKPHQLVCRLA